MTKSESVAKFMSDHKVFRRAIVAVFVWSYVDLYHWAQRGIEAGWLKGDWIGPVFVGSIVAGMVAIVQLYAKDAAAQRSE